VNSSSSPPAEAPAQAPREPVQRWRLVLERGVLRPDQAQRSQQASWEAALTASGLPVAGLDGPRGRPRFALAAPLAIGIPGEAELLDIWLTERLARWRVREALVGVMPEGHALVDLHDVWLGEAPLPGQVTVSVYRVTLPRDVDLESLVAAARRLMAADALPRTRRKGEATVAYDLRPFLEAIEVSPGPAPGEPAVLRMHLRHDPEKGVGRPDEALAAIEDRLGTRLAAIGLARERLVLAVAAGLEETPRPRGQRPRRGPGGPRPGPAGGPQG
jgi:radical SAM-linked protein